MRVRSVKNQVAQMADMPALYAQVRRAFHLGGSLGLPLNESYVVHAIEERDGVPWLYIIVDPGDVYPRPYPAAAFVVEDGKPSRYFVTVGPLTSFREWAEDPAFYERLVDEEPSAVAAFARMRRLLEVEKEDVR